MKTYICYSITLNARNGEYINTISVCASQSLEKCRKEALRVIHGTMADFGFHLNVNPYGELDIANYGWYSSITNGEIEILFVIDGLEMI